MFKTVLAALACVATMASAGAASAGVAQLFDVRATVTAADLKGGAGPSDLPTSVAIGDDLELAYRFFPESCTISGTACVGQIYGDPNFVQLPGSGFLMIDGWKPPLDAFAGSSISPDKILINDSNGILADVTLTTPPGASLFAPFVSSGGNGTITTPSGSKITFVVTSASLNTTIPEPTTWAAMIMGLFGVGAMMRARRRVVAAG